MLIRFLRRNIGTIIASVGFILLVILTFGDIGEVLTADYWRNVRNNLTSIGFMSVGLTLLQLVIKQGIGEQALQKGLNSDNTAKKYNEHKALIESLQDKMVYLPYFLQTYNDRHTHIKKREFLVNNNFNSEELLMRSNQKRLIKKYKRIRIYITVSRIKWTTTTIVYNEKGQIETLQEYRMKRFVKGILFSICTMIAVVFITDGLFFQTSQQPLWQKFVKLLTYILAIGLSSIMTISQEYEKGAFGVPNELDEINEIWREFRDWKVPDWVKKDIENINKGGNYEERDDSRGTLQKEQKVIQSNEDSNTDNLLGNDVTHDSLCNIDVT